ncbi:MAG: DUF1826 domain-containing protein [Hyphococcus sp.]
MSVTQLKSPEQLIACGSDPDVLLGIADPAITLAIWRRQLADELKNAAHLIRHNDIEFLASLNTNCLEDQKRFKKDLITSTGDEGRMLANDLIDLSRRYVEASQKQTVRIRFETVKDDGCRRFHLDNVVMRLVVTYAGPGTQWVAPTFASVARAQQQNYAGPLNCIGSGDVAIFRGKKSDAADLVLHRSPPLKSSDSARLIAVIDSLHD